MIEMVRAGLAVGRAGVALAMIFAIAWLPKIILAAPDVPVTAVDRTDALAGRMSATDVQQFACPCRLWTDSDTPVWASFPDMGPVELGVKFRSSVPGIILGIRFYKGPQNVSAHSGSLWTADGVQLAIGWFIAESLSGWQEMRFATPVRIQADTTYIASYNTDVGYYAATNAYFDTAVTRGPLTALAYSEGGNGVYRYGIHAFPNQTYQATNYWVDVVFDVAPPNAAPVARSDSYALSGPRLAVPAPGVLANDSDADSDTLTTQLRSGPTHGTLTLSSDGSFTYTPNASFAGSDQFTYVANDGIATSAPATVTITRTAVTLVINKTGTGSGDPALVASLTARPTCGPISSIRFGEAGRPFDNARVTITAPADGPAGQTAGFTYTPPASATTVTFTIQRVVPNGAATVSPIYFHDGCGEWRTFVGGGPDAFR
jgi:VCBS repeat-containing protein